MPQKSRASRLLPTLVALALASPLFGAASASAGVLATSAAAENCDTQTLEQPFTPWLDYFNYTLVPGGDFEPGSAGWSLDGASVVHGNESYFVRSPKDKRSLELGASGSAVSAPVCVALDYPVARFFARNQGLATSSLRVEVLYEDATGNVQSVEIGTVTGAGGWQPSMPMPVVANLVATLPLGKAAIAFRFRASGIGGDWRIDDVFVDPYRKS